MEYLTTLAFKVKAIYAEQVRVLLIENQLLRTDLKIKKDNGFVYLPVIKKIDMHHVLSHEVEGTWCTSDFEKLAVKIDDYKDLLQIPDSIRQTLPTSFDMIGSIIIIRLDESLFDYQKEIGEALLKTHAHIESVFRVEPVEGELRTRSVFLIAGNQQTCTVHKEYGLYYEVDIDQVYFNPRLANERMYIASQVHPGEIILDMFTGIAPFPLMIARFADPTCIIAVDKNEKAIELAKRNVKRNNHQTEIRLICDDASNVPRIVEKCQSFPDRIIMNLPFQAKDFFSDALRSIRHSAIIHFYCIGSDDEIHAVIEELNRIAEKEGFTLQIDSIRQIKTYAPHEFYKGIDITARKN